MKQILQQLLMGSSLPNDTLLSRKKIKVNAPIKPVVTAILVIVLFVNPVLAQPGNQKNKTTIKDFKPLSGKWKGSLTYLDYSSNKPVSIPANTLFEMVSDSSFDQFIYYTDEPHKNADSRYTIRENGTMLNEMKLVERKADKGKLWLVFEYWGPDGNDNRMATMQQVMQVSKKELIITKKVKYDGEEHYIQRHQYHFTASPPHP